ncbi:hypothetical protein [Pseudoalteromonas fuliginea]|uniref:Phenylacetate--CoA ligase family protein n=1 Tax=Pseudoalteromonas fuliginea TaxID=1872678 RepID=A0ABD3Y5X9_9GAMM|nr:hypothetical protein [Pseudoalteromonas fuliginea]KDC49483.1 hypothetical protein DC53_16715 [Pseudoalteromonas fuliginea]KJZ27706.1 hypothetical protein TW82_10675 [Pseudoalteromonas fuliginea]
MSKILLLIMKLNLLPSLIFGSKYKKIKSNFFSENLNVFFTFINVNKEKIQFYSNKGTLPNDITSLTDFKNSFDLIDKEIALTNFNKLLNKNLSGSALCTTGGTSGKPMKIYLPKTRYKNEFGALHALWSKIGYNFDIRAVVRNEKVEGNSFKVNLITKEVIFDGFRSDDEYLKFIYETMKKYNIKFFHGYTSNAERFFTYLLKNKLDTSFMKGIITSSENLYLHQIELFEKVKHIKHMNFYGHSEKLLLGGWCTEGNCYHFYNSYGYTELLDEDGVDITEEGEIGELVGSTNYNHFMPLFRYKTGDFAIKGKKKCPGCGFEGLSVSKILGRWHGERVYNSDNTFVTTTALNLHSHHYDAVDGLQYYQPEKGVLEIRVIPNSSFSNHIENELYQLVKSKLNSDSIIHLVKVTEIERKANGKYLLLISEIK